MAWNGKGMTVELNDLPDQVLDMFVAWTNEKIEKENEEHERLSKR